MGPLWSPPWALKRLSLGPHGPPAASNGLDQAQLFQGPWHGSEGRTLALKGLGLSNILYSVVDFQDQVGHVRSITPLVLCILFFNFSKICHIKPISVKELIRSDQSKNLITILSQRNAGIKLALASIFTFLPFFSTVKSVLPSCGI